MSDLKNKTIAEIVSDDISTASVFKKYHLDFCCGGGKTIDAACKNSEINAEDVIKDLQNLENKGTSGLNFKDWKIDFLLDYIVNQHHTYVKESVDIINEFAQKVARVHGGHHPENVKIAELFLALSKDLIEHLDDEEQNLFPAIKELLNTKSEVAAAEIEKSLKTNEEEHDNAGDIIKEIQKLSNDFAVPGDACNTYKALYNMLDEFTNDLFQHIHIENNILIPKVRAMK